MVSDITIDQALFDLATANIAAPPAIVRSILDYDEDAKGLIADLQIKATAFKSDVDAFIAGGDRARAALLAALSSNEVLPRHLEMLDTLVRQIEEKASSAAAELAGHMRSLQRLFRDLGHHLSENQKKELEAIRSRMEMAAEREIDEYSDAALFLRALRARHSPSSGGGESFDNADDLKRYLSDMVA